jgi:5'-methylthioadenosine phosphorylase
MPEAKLAREAELCYATVAMVTDYDSWHPHHDQVDVAAVIATMHGNADKARALIAAVVPQLGGDFDCPAGCNRALDTAILTAEGARDPALVARLDAVAGRVLG